MAASVRCRFPCRVMSTHTKDGEESSEKTQKVRRDLKGNALWPAHLVIIKPHKWQAGTTKVTHCHTRTCSHTGMLIHTNTHSLSATLWLFNMPEIFLKILTVLRKMYLTPPWPEWPWKRVLAKFQEKQPASPDCYSYNLMPPSSPFFIAWHTKQIMILRTRLKLQEEFK